MNTLNKTITRSRAYDYAIAIKKEARVKLELATERLSACAVYERGAELASQAFIHIANSALHARFGDLSDREREIALAFVRYALYGRSDEE